MQDVVLQLHPLHCSGCGVAGLESHHNVPIWVSDEDFGDTREKPVKHSLKQSAGVESERGKRDESKGLRCCESCTTENREQGESKLHLIAEI